MSDKSISENEIYAILAKSTRLVQANYERNAEFFLNSNSFIYYLDQMKANEVGAGIVSSINLQCTGHASFAPHKVAARFLQNLQQITDNNNEITKIKIKLSGFDLSKELDIGGMSMNVKKPTLIEKLTELLAPKINSLTSLEIRICGVKNCRQEDFRSIMELGMDTAAKGLSNLSYEFSDWAFAKTPTDKDIDVLNIYEKGIKKVEHDRLYQPTVDEFLKMLQSSFQKTMGQPLMQLKKFRLEISTWYYTDYQVERFFQNLNQERLNDLPKSDKIHPRIQYFHNQFKSKISSLIREIMIQANRMELDLRNWNKKFDMGTLKNSILNIPSQRKNPLSTISKRLSGDTKHLVKAVVSKVQQSMIMSMVENKKNEKKKMKEDEEEKEPELDFVVVV